MNRSPTPGLRIVISTTKLFPSALGSMVVEYPNPSTINASGENGVVPLAAQPTTAMSQAIALYRRMCLPVAMWVM